MADLVGKVEGGHQSHGFHREWSVKWTNNATRRMSTTKKEQLQKTEHGMEKSHKQGKEDISGSRPYNFITTLPD